ncbi:hypothetical protein PV327_010948 [Microctonus hyperodae]|uniref:H/ACA ribonucleoprotein complex non-core subunit NAF1 n=1 Tax=Microctonus hyperodae TaxID=165561 RepID=A0AA39C8Q1_MICHY|nr:hypothetical protein PV327_010948 [Microctonus hyperodae]
MELQIQMTDALRDIAVAYNDSSEDEHECIIDEKISTLDPIQNNHYRSSEINNDVDSENSSDDDSSDSSSNDSSTESSTEADSDNEIDNVTASNNRCHKKNREKGEFDDLPPIEDLQISVPQILCDPVGEVGWIVDQMVVVTPKPLKPTLNIDTVLFIERGERVLGRIFDVFGPVSEPHYCIRFNNSEHIKNNKIQVGMTVYYCPNTPYTTLVFMTDLLKIKATDDFGEDEHPVFSDDEEERAYYSSLKQKEIKSKTNLNKNNGEIPMKRFRNNANGTGWKSKHPWNERQFQQKNNYCDSNDYNNIQKQNIWQRLPITYNQWQSDSALAGSSQSLTNVNSTSYHPETSSAFQSNINYSWQPKPNFMWPTNDSTCTPTQIQNTPLFVRTTPLTSLPSSLLPPLPPPPPPPGF